MMLLVCATILLLPLLVIAFLMKHQLELLRSTAVQQDLQIYTINSMIRVLAKQTPNGVWFLSANLVIAEGATFRIDSTDTKWLKINSNVTSDYLIKYQ